MGEVEAKSGKIEDIIHAAIKGVNAANPALNSHVKAEIAMEYRENAQEVLKKQEIIDLHNQSEHPHKNKYAPLCASLTTLFRNKAGEPYRLVYLEIDARGAVSENISASPGSAVAKEVSAHLLGNTQETRSVVTHNRIFTCGQ